MARYEVDTTNDTGVNQTKADTLATDVTDGGGFSLREAILWANSTDGTNGTTDTDDEVVFVGDAFSGAATITLTGGENGGELEITDTVSITGTEAGVTIDANDAFRVFNVTSETATLADLTLANGRVANATATAGDNTDTGAAINVANGATVTFTDGAITGSDAADDGGAIFSLGTATLTNVELSANTGENDETDDATEAGAAAEDNVLTDEAAGATLTGGTVFAVGNDDAPKNITGTIATSDAITVDGTYGTLTLGTDGAYSYQAGTDLKLAKGETGTDAFTYKVMDASGDVLSTATLTVTVTGANSDPEAVNDETGEDGILPNVLANDTDPDDGATKVVTRVSTFELTNPSDSTDDSGTAGAAFGVNASTSPSIEGEFGTLTIAADGSVSYAVDAEKVRDLGAAGGTDVFQYTMSDTLGGTDEALIRVAVSGQNDAPDAVDDTFDVEDPTTAVSGNVITDSDSDVDTAETDLTVTLAGVNGETQVDVPDSGTVSITGQYGSLAIGADGGVTYTPDEDDIAALGEGEFADVFSYTLSDGDLTDTATVSFTVTGENAAPSGDDPTLNATEVEAADNADLNLTDPDDGDTARVSKVQSDAILTNIAEIAEGETVVIEGQYGKLTIASDGSYSYADGGSLAAADGTENDVFTYSVTDGKVATPVPQTLTIQVTGTDDKPVAVDDMVTVSAARDGNVLANDFDLDAGDDPVVTNVKIEGATGTGSPVSGNDATGLVGERGVLSIEADGSYSYTPFRTFEAPEDGEPLDAFEYTIEAGSGADNTATATLSIFAGPKATDDAFTPADAEDSANALANDAVATNSSVSSVVVEGEEAVAVSGSDASDVQGTYGVLSIEADGDYSYAAAGDDFAALASGATATDVFTYTLSDGTETDTADITVTVTGVNDAPVAADIAVAAADAEAGDEASVMGSVTDADAEEVVTVSKVKIGAGETDTDVTEDGVEVAGSFGTLTIAADGSYSYAVSDAAAEIKAGETATDAFDYTVTDDEGETDTATITVSVAGPTPMNVVQLDEDGRAKGTEGNDMIVGDGGANRLKGGKGDDELSGGRGEDRLKGNRGDDTVDGGSGDDSVKGNGGNDNLRGGSGDDKMRGGAGDDRIAGEAGDDRMKGQDGVDTFVFIEGADVVTDMAAEDKVELSAGLWDGTMNAAQIVDEFGEDMNNGKFMLDFGGGDSLKFKGAEDTILTMDMIEAAIVLG